MIDLILTDPAEGPATLFTRNFRVHAGLPIGMYDGGPRAPVALLYGKYSQAMVDDLSREYDGLLVIPSRDDDAIPEEPCHYETMTLKAPILATMQRLRPEGFVPLVKTYEGGPLVLKGETGRVPTLIFTADLVKATIRILSGEVEHDTGKDARGRHNPPPAAVTLTPSVSLHFNLLENAVRYLFKVLKEPLLHIPRWPGSAPSAIFLSHDIDAVRKWTFKRSVYEIGRAAGDILRMRENRLGDVIHSISEGTKGRDPYWSFDDLLVMEHGNGFYATWFFAPYGGDFTRRENDIDPVYHRKPSEINAMIRRIIENGDELALHGIRNAYLNENGLTAQLASYEDRTGFKILGVRHHYLMFRHGRTLEAAASAGLLYDATLGFSDRAGFRNGMASPCFPFPADQPGGSLVELPLHFMDTMFGRSGLDPETVKRKVTECYLFAKAAGGLFSLLVHPGNMDALEIPELENYYHSLLLRFRLDGACSMTGADLAHWWRAREEVLRRLEYAPGAWRLRDYQLPKGMHLAVTAPDMQHRKVVVEGVSGDSVISGDTATVRPADGGSSGEITVFVR